MLPLVFLEWDGALEASAFTHNLPAAATSLTLRYCRQSLCSAAVFGINTAVII